MILSVSRAVSPWTSTVSPSPPVTCPLRRLDDRRAAAGDPVRAEERLEEPAVAVVEVALDRQESVPEHAPCYLKPVPS